MLSLTLKLQYCTQTITRRRLPEKKDPKRRIQIINTEENQSPRGMHVSILCVVWASSDAREWKQPRIMSQAPLLKRCWGSLTWAVKWTALITCIVLKGRCRQPLSGAYKGTTKCISYIHVYMYASSQLHRSPSRSVSGLGVLCTRSMDLWLAKYCTLPWKQYGVDDPVLARTSTVARTVMIIYRRCLVALIAFRMQHAAY